MRIVIVSCGKRKRTKTLPAQDLYVSPLFRTARQFAERHSDQWFILSAKHGLLEPERRVAPYEFSFSMLNDREFPRWLSKTSRQVRDLIPANSDVTILAGKAYVKGISPTLEDHGCSVIDLLEGLPLGARIGFIRGFDQAPTRLRDLDRFYTALACLRRAGFVIDPFSDLAKHKELPLSGVYFFSDPRQTRASAPSFSRIVRVGTHAVSRKSNSTLRARLRTHLGTREGSGNHRGSVFRLHVGSALIRRGHLGLFPQWAQGQSADQAVRRSEAQLEHRVSQYLGKLAVTYLAVEDVASPDSARAYIERNSIGLLSGAYLFDPPSKDWLGFYCKSSAVIQSGLWNVNHINEGYDDCFLDILEAYVDMQLRGARTRDCLAPADWRALRSKRTTALQPELFEVRK